VVEAGEIKLLGMNRIVMAVSRTGLFVKGDYLIVESDRGQGMARALMDSRRTVASPGEGFDVVRRLSSKDAEAIMKRDEQRIEEARKAFKTMVKAAGLEMKLSNIEITRDEQKIVFYFTAPGRMDFRQLVRDLAHTLHSRIELRQIGVRDEAKAVGGLGPCGLPLCCASYMRDFMAVSMKLAKDQGLNLNPQKYSGMCGRLMCCLAYEAGVYKDLAKHAPRQGSRVKTPAGQAQVVDVALLRGRVKVRLENGEFKDFSFDEVSSRS
jgi:cell fate regulator YaaT (PSP1 superfamily)